MEEEAIVNPVEFRVLPGVFHGLFHRFNADDVPGTRGDMEGDGSGA
jgi:hypothetical protein